MLQIPEKPPSPSFFSLFTQKNLTIMDFLMTMSSDDEATTPMPSTSKPSLKSTVKKAKLTRKEQLDAKKANKATKAKQNKRKRKEGSSDEDEGDDQVVEGEEDEGMDGNFLFDGLGGGFVGEKRLSVWDGGQDYALPTRPNAIVRQRSFDYLV